MKLKFHSLFVGDLITGTAASPEEIAIRNALVHRGELRELQLLDGIDHKLEADHMLTLSNTHRMFIDFTSSLVRHWVAPHDGRAKSILEENLLYIQVMKLAAQPRKELRRPLLAQRIANQRACYIEKYYERIRSIPPQ